MSNRLRACIYACVALLVGVLAYLLGVGSFLGQWAESIVLNASAFDADPAGPLRLVSTTNLLIALIAIGVLALWKHGIFRAVSILAASSVALVASQVLKERWLERPELLEFEAANTFPSGHMTVFTVLVGALLWALPVSGRWVAMALSSVLLGVVSWQLLEYGWHRPSDLLGAQALAVLAFALAAAIGTQRSKRAAAGRRGGFNETAFRFMSVLMAIIGIVLVAGALGLVAIATATRNDALMLNSGEIALIGTGVLASSALARLCPS